MPVYESPLPYSMMLRDTLVILDQNAPALAKVLDVKKWPEDLNRRTEISGNAASRRVTKPVSDELHPWAEDGLLEPMFSSKDPTAHYFDVQSKEGRLLEIIVADMNTCKQNLPGFLAGRIGMEVGLKSLGRMAHRVIDICLPFNLIGGEHADMLRGRFMGDLEVHVHELPFLWSFIDKEMPEFTMQSPYMDKTAASVDAERRMGVYSEAIGNCYIAGNGFPAAKQIISEWYNGTINALTRAILFCCR